MSHIPVREALRRLESEGLLSLRPGRSALVAALSEEDLVGIYRLRKLIEGDLATRVPGGMTEETLAETEQALSDYSKTAREPATLAEAHHAFHSAMLADVAGPADMRVLSMLWKSSDRYLHLLMPNLDSGPEATSSRIGEHQHLLDLAREGSGVDLQKAWVSHLDSSEKALLSALAESEYAARTAEPVG